MKLIYWLDNNLEKYILVFLSCFTVIIIFTQVVMRYVFDNSLSWSEEIARYAFIWMIYIGVSYGVKEQKHLNVDAFSMLFEKKGKIILSMISTISFFIFSLIISIYGFDIVVKITRESAALQIPMEWVYAAPAVGMALTSIRLIQRLVLQMKELKSLKEEKGYDLREGAV
ncbi:TRAP transporter small permease [Halobacillus sp. B23F22_1]|uniref:TRAP transporter small permease n=1 Tax=Halobacillus sp. B23F22_1 TaxID=3459514 RepID=UPI00373E2B76